VELAQEQFVPVSPKLLNVLAFAFIGGLVFGVGRLVLVWLVGRLSTRWECLRGIDAVFNDTAIAGRDYPLRRLIRWVLRPVGYLVLFLALWAATLNIYLWLESREDYNKWRLSPVDYMAAKAARIAESITSRL
jgi:hypothetical protein